MVLSDGGEAIDHDKGVVALFEGDFEALADIGKVNLILVELVLVEVGLAEVIERGRHIVAAGGVVAGEGCCINTAPLLSLFVEIYRNIEAVNVGWVRQGICRPRAARKGKKCRLGQGNVVGAQSRGPLGAWGKKMLYFFVMPWTLAQIWWMGQLSNVCGVCAAAAEKRSSFAGRLDNRGASHVQAARRWWGCDACKTPLEAPEKNGCLRCASRGGEQYCPSVLPSFISSPSTIGSSSNP